MQATLERLRQRREQTGGEGGFTLIELLIVIVILGILAAIVVFAVQNLSGTSASAACQSDYKTVETAVETYKAQMGSYPTATVTDTDAVTQNVAASTTFGAKGSELLTTNASGSVNNAISGSATVGPWLKDIPANSGHYSISVSNNGLGTITVLNSSNTPVVAGCSAIS